MPRYSDEWLIDKVLFEVTFGGGCACCSFNFMPNGNEGIIQSMSEFETDAANAEISALDKLPWPQEVSELDFLFCLLGMLFPLIKSSVDEGSNMDGTCKITTILQNKHERL